MDHRGTTALITGASSGLGERFAVDLAAGGAGAALRAALDERAIGVTTLVNCAGLGATGSFAQASADTVAGQIAVNVSALVDVTHTLLPDLVASGRGVLVDVATKVFVLSFTEALSAEMATTGVRVLCLSPGPTRTEFYAVSGTSESGTRFQTPEQVVATALDALDREHAPASVVSGRANQLVAAASGLSDADQPTVLCGLLGTVSRGRVPLCSADPAEAPRMEAGCLGAAADRGVTGAIGHDERAVVDDRLAVRGLEHLWVAGASVVPTVPRGHPGAATMMIAERAADLLASR